MFKELFSDKKKLFIWIASAVAGALVTYAVRQYLSKKLGVQLASGEPEEWINTFKALLPSSKE